MPDEKEITRCFIFYNDLIAGGKSYDEIIRPVTNRLNKILDIEKGEYIEEPDLYSISMRKEITLFHKIMNYIIKFSSIKLYRCHPRLGGDLEMVAPD